MTTFITILALTLVVYGLYAIRATLPILAVIGVIVVSLTVGTTNANAATELHVYMGVSLYTTLLVVGVIASLVLAYMQKSFTCVLVAGKFALLLILIGSGLVVLH